jgi:hypothetical protein
MLTATSGKAAIAKKADFLILGLPVFLFVWRRSTSCDDRDDIEHSASVEGKNDYSEQFIVTSAFITRRRHFTFIAAAQRYSGSSP